MPASKRNAPKPKQTPILLWAGIAVAIVIVAGLVVSYWPKPAPPAPEPAVSVASTPVPIAKKHIYSETSDPRADIAAALVQAKREHKRVILDFGGDWCGDCQVLDIYFHQQPNDDLLAKDFILVHVWIGHMDANLDIPAKYGVPVTKGVPALAVLSPAGETLYAQKTGEFEKMRDMDPASVTEFLSKWKI